MCKIVLTALHRHQRAPHFIDMHIVSTGEGVIGKNNHCIPQKSRVEIRSPLVTVYPKKKGLEDDPKHLAL